jgi:deoxyribodipyrimidine photo-lyase
MKTIIVWFRNDLRVHDHPALSLAVQDADYVIPIFILDKSLLTGERYSPNRNRFLLECLQDLKHSLQKMGADLIIRDGDAQAVLSKLAKDHNADAIYYSADYTPYAIARDKQLKQNLEGVEFRSFGGRLAVSALEKLRTKAGTVHKVFTPFYNNWLQIQRRELAEVPSGISLPGDIDCGALPSLGDIADSKDLSPNALPGGETKGRQRLQDFIEDGISTYKDASNDMATDATSRLSSYLHFGCLSPREIETLLPEGVGATAWYRQLAWREFYHYIIFNNPGNRTQEFQERFRALKWDDNPKLLTAWQTGNTGYPVVDAAMRQLLAEGWMHNRARLIVGSFLTKDLWIDWRLGEAYFMKLLIDGDVANNNGNWQWIASVGVDPAPVYRRLYNPTTQQKNYDPTGAYVRKYVPELANVPDKYLAEPWTMPEDIQHESNCVIAEDYPAPIVDHKVARVQALEHYQAIPRP